VLLPAVLSAVAHFALMGISYGFITLRAKELAASAALISNLTVIHLVVFTPSVLLATVLLRRFELRPLLIASFVIIAAGAACAAGASIPWLIASQALVAIGYGICYPILMGMSIQRVDGRERTTAMGVHQSVYAIGMFAGPWLCGILAARLGMPAMFVITALGCLVIGVAGTLWATRNGQTSQVMKT
jgi:MFS family permease